jgi:hypothetical protein
MRVLLLHPDDSPRRGPWSQQRWDLIVDLGRSSEFSAAEWTEQTGCPILRSDSFREGVEDLKLVRGALAVGQGRLIDEEGIDWWTLTALLIAPQVEAMLTLRRVATQIVSKAELWATRAGWPGNAIAFLLRGEIQIFSGNVATRLARRAAHYGGLFHRFSAAQVKEIFLDKYDPGYEWRSRFASDQQGAAEPVILVPSAYGNVSRMAASYAQMLPDQTFLLVATRQSGKQFEAPSNMRSHDLASYATSTSTASESAAILEEWGRLKVELCAMPEFEVLSRAGTFDAFPNWLRSGPRVRNAWREVLQRETVCGVLCGDDSNVYTRLPVLLAARRKIPTVDFHHGAMDGRYLLKDLPSDTYLAKNAMERDYLLRVCGLPPQKVILGAPCPTYAASPGDRQLSPTSWVIFFSEPYENAGMRTEEVYREILPSLCRLARENSRGIVLKLHPFESISDRKRIVQALLPEDDLSLVTVLDGPLSERLLSSAWFGLTVESTTVMDCLRYGVPCFLVGWLTLSPYEYAQQYARFGVGDVLRSVNEIADIPVRLANFSPQETKQQSLWKMADPEMLRQWLRAGSPRQALARRVS